MLATIDDATVVADSDARGMRLAATFSRAGSDTPLQRRWEQPMSPQPLETRVESLDRRVTMLEQLPARIEAVEMQIVHLREDMHGEFSALRIEIRDGNGRIAGPLHEEIRVGDEETRRVLREEIRAGDEETRRVLREEIRAGDEETRRVLREEIRAGDDRVMAQARVLHEDLVERLALLLEGRRPRKRPKRR